MRENGKDRDHELHELSGQLNDLSLEELEQIKHTLDSIKQSRNEDLHYLGHSLGIDLYNCEFPTMRLGMHNANTYGMVQGGALFTFADVALGYKIMASINRETEKVFTLEMKMNYIRPAQGKKVIAKTEILHFGGKTVVAECRIEDELGQLAAQALGTFYLVRNKKEV